MNLRKKLIEDIESLPEEKLEQVYLQAHRLFLASAGKNIPDSDSVIREPSPRLYNKGASFKGDMMEPAIPAEDWDMLKGDSE
jgi:hypothetical protein